MDNDFLQIEEDDNIISPEIIRVRRIVPIRTSNDITEHFRTDINKMELEDVAEGDLTLESLLQRIKDMRSHRILLKQPIPGSDKFTYIIIECDLMVNKYIVLRGRKIIGTGNADHAIKIVYRQIKKEHPKHTVNLRPEEIDTIWLSNFCMQHYGNKNEIQIIAVIP